MSFGSGGFGGFGANNTNTGSGFGGFGSNNNTTGFGSNNNNSNTTGFGNSTTGGSLFGNSSTSAFGGGGTSGGFGATNNNNTGSIFGAKTGGFGGTTTGSGGLFGNTSSGTSGSSGFGFGTNTNPTSTSTGFGTGGNSMFGTSNANKPASGFSTSGVGGGIFGTSATPNTGFGTPVNNTVNASTTATSGPVGDPPGTAGTAFAPLTEKEGASNAQNAFQNILFQEPYRRWSSEELRLADYNQGRRYGGAAGTGFATTTSSFGTAFGSTPQNTTGAFGATNNATSGGMFGNNSGNTTGGFGPTANSGFGTTGGGLFGNKPASTTGNSLFGNTSQPTQSGGLFGTTSGTSTFGNTSNNTGFGATNNTTSTTGGLFGNTNNQNKPSGFSFGNTANNNNNNTTGAFGTPNNTATGFGATSTAGGGLFGSTLANTTTGTGGLFGSNTTGQNTNTSTPFGNTGFGAQNQTQTSGGLFGNNQAKPAGTGGLFGSTTNTNQSGGLFGSQANTAQTTGFGNNTQTSGGLFGKPAASSGGLFGATANPTQNAPAGGGLFGALGSNNQAQQANTGGGGLFGSSLNANNQPKPSMFGTSQPSTSGGLFGSQPAQQGSLFGTPNNNQQQPNSGFGSSLFGNSQNNQSQTTQSLTANINDPTAYGVGPMFGNLVNGNDPGPLATPLSSKKTPRRPSILPTYKLNPASATRFVTPQKRGFGFSYSTYGTPNSPSSVASTPGNMSHSMWNGSLTRSLAKSVSTSNLRRSFNVDDSLLAPGAFSSSSSSKLFGGSNNVKRLVINKELRSDLFSTPTKEGSTGAQPSPNGNGTRRTSKRVSFGPTNEEVSENGDDVSESVAPTAEALGFIRPNSRANGVNGAKHSSSSSSASEMEQVKGMELAVVHEEGDASPVAQTASPAGGASDKELGEYWMRPTKEEIRAMNRVQRQKVQEFTVGRKNSGWVQFKVPVDLVSVDVDNLFDDIVVLDVRSCTVYPNSAKKPAVGKGLNVPARICLENSRPRGNRLKKSVTIAKHIDRLKRIENTHFVQYNDETGEWTFDVDHFTTYGLDDSDDEDEDVEVEPHLDAEAPGHMSSSPLPEAQRSFDEDDTFDFSHNKRSLPGAFDTNEVYDEDGIQEMAEINQSQLSFLADSSAGSKSKALVPVAQGYLDDEYAMSEDQEGASTSLGHHLAAEHEDDSFSASQLELIQETPAGIMRARMRAIKESATPMKVQVAAGDDWMDMLQKTISPQKRDRVLLKSLHEADAYRSMKDSVQDQSPAKRRVVSDGRGFATSIDLMKSIFDQAKAPADSPRASLRPKSVKWPPYKRMTKNLDENDMDAKERIWHNTLRPTWGPSGTLVFASTPMETPFGRSGRVIEKNGLMMIMKGGVVSESQDIQIAKFTNEMSAKALRAHIGLTDVYLMNGIPTVQGPRVSLKEFATESLAKNPSAEHEKLVWELATVLFDSIKVPLELQSDPDAEEKIRRESLSRFWERLVEDETNKGTSLAASFEEKALASLAGHRIPEACKYLLDGKNFRLATLITLIGTNDGVKKDMREQFREWQDANVLSEFSEAIRALYEMLSGNVCVCEGTKGGSLENRMDSFVISQKFGLNWKQAFGLRLWYAISAEESIADAVGKFQEDVDQDRETPAMTWSVENGIKLIWNDADLDKRRDLLWGLLQLYSDGGTDLEAVLRPENSQLSPLDYRLTWQLGQALTATGKVSFSKNMHEKADSATLSFAAQLTTEGSWLEAAFVLLHLSDADARCRAIQEHLCRHAGLIGNEESDSFKKLTEKLKMPIRWIWHAKALYMRSVKKDAAGEVYCLLRAESYAEAHRTFVKEVAPVSIIERDYDGLNDLLLQFDGRQSQIPDWNVGGDVYRAFLQLITYQSRQEQPPPALVNGLLEGLPAMHGNTPEAGVIEYAALTEMAAMVANVVGTLAKKGQMDHQRILKLPLTEDVLLKHSRDLAWSHYTAVMTGH